MLWGSLDIHLLWAASKGWKKMSKHFDYCYWFPKITFILALTGFIFQTAISQSLSRGVGKWSEIPVQGMVFKSFSSSSSSVSPNCMSPSCEKTRSGAALNEKLILANVFSSPSASSRCLGPRSLLLCSNQHAPPPPSPLLPLLLFLTHLTLDVNPSCWSSGLLEDPF